jgi:L-rhamnose mutarotase
MLLVILAAAFLGQSCSRERFTEKVFVVQIRPGEDRLKEYLEYHRAVWPEVEKGFEHAGYRQIRLLRSQHTVVMIIKVPEGADLAAMGKKAESYNKRCAEWNQLMAGYQQGVPGAAPGQTWTAAEPFYLFGRE